MNSAAGLRTETKFLSFMCLFNVPPCSLSKMPCFTSSA